MLPNTLFLSFQIMNIYLLKESLESENIPDPMDAEQTWPTEEEIAEAEAERKAKRKIKKIPKGFSDYQAAWIPDCDAGRV